MLKTIRAKMYGLPIFILIVLPNAIACSAPTPTIGVTGLTPTPTETNAPTSTPFPTETSPPVHTLTPTQGLPFEVIRAPYVDSSDSSKTIKVYLPENASRKPFSLLSVAMPLEVERDFARRGYTIVTTPMQFGNTPYLAELRSLFCSLAWMHANAGAYDISLEHVAVMGGSMGGGHAALLAVVDDATRYLEGCPYPLPDTGRVDCVISFAGVFDYSQEADFFSGFIEIIAEEMMGGMPDEVPDAWKEMSAINWISGNEPPFLLLHGKADVNVTPHQSEIFAAALEEAGIDVELVMIDGVGHVELFQSREAFQVVESYLARLIEQP